jgi:hypothetical protein
MNRAMGLLFRGGAALVALSNFTAAAAAPPAVLPNGPGKPEVQATCLKCHAADVIVKKHATKDAWDTVISDMQNRGAEVADSDFDTISVYLAAHFGRAVNVNKAATGDFVNWFSMTKAEADAMVAYRDSHGDFKSLDGLLKVPDVDPKKLQAQVANIAFQDATPTDGH